MSLAREADPSLTPRSPAFGRLEEGAGTQFDPNLIEVFVRVMKRRVEASPEESRN